MICFSKPKEVLSFHYEEAYRTMNEATAYHHKAFQSGKLAIGRSIDTFTRLNGLDRK